jgi:hypothetical protein
VEAAAEVGHQHFDPCARRTLANGIDTSDEMCGAAIAQIIAIDARDHDMAQPQQRDRVREMRGFVGIRGLGPSVRDVAKRAAPRAQITQDHERRRAAAEAFPDIGA